MKEDEDMYNVRANDADSAQSRALATLNVTTTTPANPHIISRRHFPSKNNNNNPHVCLAFLSCCGRTDLLNHTLAGGTYLEKKYSSDKVSVMIFHLCVHLTLSHYLTS